MGKSKVNKKLFHSKVLVFSLIVSFVLLIVTDASPRKGDFNSGEEFKPVVKVRKAGETITAAQKERFERLVEEGKKLLLEDMDYEGAIRKFNEAGNLSITREQQAGALFYLSLAYFASSRETRIEDCAKKVRELIEIDYYRELDELMCPPRYMQLFQGIKKEYGALRIQSKPAGADVYINDSKEPIGKTPITIGSKAGTVKIRVKKGKREKKDTLRVTAGETATSPTYVLKGRSSFIYVLGGIVLAGGVGAALLSGKKGNGGTPPSGPATGSIQVNSTPEGASVYLDGNDTGKTTNTTLTNVSPGNHTVKLVKEGYVDYEETVSVTAGQTTAINANLTQHSLTVISPTSSSSWIKGEEVDIKWITDASISFQGNAGYRVGLNSVPSTRNNVFLSFKERGFRSHQPFHASMRSRKNLEVMCSSKNRGLITNKSSKFQSMSGRISSYKKNNLSSDRNNLSYDRTEGIRGKRGAISLNRIDLNPSVRFSTQMIKPLEKVRPLTITNVKIELYKGSDRITIIVKSTSNSGSYTWTVDSNLLEGSDYKVRVLAASEPSVYGESGKFSISSGYIFEKKWGVPGRGGNSEFNDPHGVAVDSSGNVYVADTLNHRIMKFDSSGKFIKKWGSYGWSNNQFNGPHGVAIDSADNIYVVDGWNNRIIKFTSSGDFITKWGSRGSGDNEFSDPKGIAVDSSGNVYVADRQNNRIMKFDSDGDFITKWGKQGEGNSEFNDPHGVAVDSSGNVYVADTSNHRIMKFDSSGKFIKKWGSYGWSNNQFSGPHGVAVDSADNIYVVDGWNNRIIKFTSSGDFITKWGSWGSGDNEFSDPKGIAVDSSKKVYVADRKNNRIMKFTSSGDFITKWGKQGIGNYDLNYPSGIALNSSKKVYVADRKNNRIMKFTSSGDFITKWGSRGGNNSEFNDPHGVAVDSTGNVYVADKWNNRIMKFTSSGDFITKWGSFGSGNYEFHDPLDVAVDNSGYVYVSDVYNHRIMKFTANGIFFTKWGSRGSGNNEFNEPRGIAVDSSGNVYVADTNNHRIMKFTSDGNFIRKWGSYGWSNNQFNGPHGVAVDSSGIVYVADTYNHRIMKFDSDGDFITKWGKQGEGNYEFKYPYGVAVDSSGIVYVADTYNHRIMKFSPVSGSLYSATSNKFLKKNRSLNKAGYGSRFDLLKSQVALQQRKSEKKRKLLNLKDRHNIEK